MGLLQSLKSLNFISPFTCAGENRGLFIQSYVYVEVKQDLFKKAATFYADLKKKIKQS